MSSESMDFLQMGKVHRTIVKIYLGIHFAFLFGI